MLRSRSTRLLLVALAFSAPNLAAHASTTTACSDQEHTRLFNQVMQAARSDKVDMKSFETDYLPPFLRCHRDWE